MNTVPLPVQTGGLSAQDGTGHLREHLESIPAYPPDTFDEEDELNRSEHQSLFKVDQDEMRNDKEKASPSSSRWNVIKRVLNSPKIGIVYAVLSTLIQALAHFAAQYSLQSSTQLPQTVVVFVRCVEQMLILVPLLLMLRSRVCYSRNKWILLGGISFAGYGSYISLYYVLEMVPLSIALSISGTMPFFAGLFSICILKERCILIDFVLGIVSALGVLLIARPRFLFGQYGKKERSFFKKYTDIEYESIFIVGCGIALLFAVCRALYLVLGRKWAKILREENGKPDTVVTVFYPSVLGTLVTPIIILASKENFVIPESTAGSIALFSTGISSALGLFCLMLALKTQTATVVGVIRNLEVVWAFFLQYLVFKHVPSLWNVGGSVVILSATVLAMFRDRINNCFCCHGK